MFFILGINTKTEEIGTANNVVCPACGRLTMLKIIVIYEVFHFFFIPLFKWNRRYLAEAGCCGAVFELDADAGRAFERGERSDIDPQHLHRTGGYGGGFSDDYDIPAACPHCGAELPPDARFCHRCGNRI